MYCQLLALAVLVSGAHAAALIPTNYYATPCGYCVCYSPIQNAEQTACKSSSCQCVQVPTYIPAEFLPTVSTSTTEIPTTTTTATTTSTTTTEIATTVATEDPRVSEISDPCSSPLAINGAPTSSKFGGLPQDPPATSPVPTVQAPPNLLNLKDSPCNRNQQNGGGLNIPSVNTPCNSPCKENVIAPCSSSLPELPNLEELPCCFITVANGTANVFCGCSGNGTCIYNQNLNEVSATCASQRAIEVNVKDLAYPLPCQYANTIGIDLSKIEGCPTVFEPSSSSGISFFTSIVAILTCLFCFVY